MTNPFENLHDLYNESALLYVAISDYQTYQSYGIAPEDYFADLSAKVARLAEAIYESKGQSEVGPLSQLNEVLTLGRDSKVLSNDEWAWCWERFNDPPLGCIADADKLKRHRRGRDMRELHLRAARAIEAGRIEEAVSHAEEARQLVEGQMSRDVVVLTADEAIAEWRREVERIAQGGGISLGLPLLKSAVGPLFPGAMLVVGAQTSNGKSTFVSEMLMHAADDGTMGGLIAVEDPNLITVSRWVSALSGVPSKLLNRGIEVEKTDQAQMRVAEYGRRMQLAQCLGSSEQDVMTRMTVMARRGAKLIVVDYIGVVQASVRQQDRRNEVRWVMTRLKAHAARLGVALVIVSQLTRPKAEKAEDYEPSKHDLKEAGDLENAAEYIVLLWRNAESDFAPIKLKLAKAKTGGTGTEWLMQREVFAEDAWGRRVRGSGRLREVVREHRYAWDREFPLLREDYEALLASLAG